MVDPVHPSLRKMIIQSADTLRGQPIDQVIGDGWRDKPPLLIGPRGKPESDVLLKGLIRKGIPPALRCAVWLSNVIQAVHTQEDANYWHEYRTLEKVRSLDFAYENLLKPLVNDEMEKRPGESVFQVTNEVWKQRSIPNYGKSAEAPRVAGMTSSGEQALKRVLIALEHVLGIDYAPLLPTLAALLLTCMSESYAFTTIREMAHGAAWFLATSRREHEIGRAHV